MASETVKTRNVSTNNGPCSCSCPNSSTATAADLLAISSTPIRDCPTQKDKGKWTKELQRERIKFYLFLWSRHVTGRRGNFCTLQSGHWATRKKTVVLPHHHTEAAVSSSCLFRKLKDNSKKESVHRQLTSKSQESPELLGHESDDTLLIISSHTRCLNGMW